MMQSRNGFTTYLRGIGTASSGASEEGSVQVYLDGILCLLVRANGSKWWASAFGGLCAALAVASPRTPMTEGLFGPALLDPICGDETA